MLIDLQLHSTYSDGYLSPTELAKFISSQGVKVASLTDHHTVGGINEFKSACAKLRVKAIAGMELYVDFKGKRFNLLWYNFDTKSPELHEVLRQSQIKRRNQIRRVLAKLVANGFKINEGKIMDKYSHYIPLNHIVNEILSNQTNKNKIIKQLNSNNPREDEIINNYFRSSKFGGVKESRIDLDTLLNLRKKIGGQFILNHPGKYNQLDKDLIKELKNIGVDGMEVISPHHTIGAVMYSQYLALKNKMIMTGSTDFHRSEQGNIKIKNVYNYFKVDSKYLNGIEKIIG